MQMALIILIGYDFVKDFALIKCKITVAVTRFICAYLLHFAMEPEFRQSLSMLKYWCNHSNNLTQKKLEEPVQPEYEKEDGEEPKEPKD